jgi:hypothetical protein
MFAILHRAAVAALEPEGQCVRAGQCPLTAAASPMHAVFASAVRAAASGALAPAAAAAPPLLPDVPPPPPPADDERADE